MKRTVEKVKGDPGNHFWLNGRIWIDRGEDAFLGEGKVQLLQAIDELGSLRQAAASMNMSYKKAWLSIRKMNDAADQPIVLLSRGGKEGGKAELTAYAHDILEKYVLLTEAFRSFLDKQNQVWKEMA